MPPALKALVAQFTGCVLAYLLARNTLLPPGLLPLVAAQALAAVGVAALLRSARWWLPIHLFFMPLALGALKLQLAPAWYLAAFALLALVYWSSFRTQVPLYLTNRRTTDAVAALLPTTRPVSFLDLGSGTASLLRALARQRPDSRFTGIESAPAPWALGWLLGRGMANLRCIRGNFFATSWHRYDVVYAFLSPVPMAAVWLKAQAELAPGALLVSNSFRIPAREPERIIEVDDRRRTRLYVYRIAADEARK